MRFRHDQGAQVAPAGAAGGGLLVERPPPGLARGIYPASPLALGALGSAFVLVTLIYYFFRLRKTRS